MKTIKLPIEYSNKDDLTIISEYIRLQNNVIRIAYNRFKENLSEKEIRLFYKSIKIFNVILYMTITLNIYKKGVIHDT